MFNIIDNYIFIPEWLCWYSRASYHIILHIWVSDCYLTLNWGPSWSWSYGSWIYNFLCNLYLSPLTVWVQILFWRSVLDTTLCDNVCQWLATGRWFSTVTPVSTTNIFWPPRYNWNIVENGIKHNNTNPKL
jgi:hypothetical protein